jgi:hypothetical protein
MLTRYKFKPAYGNSGDSISIEVDSVYFVNSMKHIIFNDTITKICAGEEKFEFNEGADTNAGLFYTDCCRSQLKQTMNQT